MASKILVAALLASGALGRALPNGREIANVEARAPAVAGSAVHTLNVPAVKKRQEEGGSGGFDFGDYESQEDFWAEWDTEEAFFEEHASQFESEADFWEQLEAALPSEGGGDAAFSFADYESQEDFWAEWGTEEEFFAAHGSQFESEDDFWEQLEAALPSEDSGGGAEEGGAEEGPGDLFPGFGDGDADEGSGEEFPGFPGGGFGEGSGGDNSEEAPEAPEAPERDPIIVVGPIED